jgi:tetraacyldisaccharide 4'-kinase
VAVAAGGEPESLVTPHRAVGAVLSTERAFRDHHRYTGDDVRIIAASAMRADAVVCTLKDAVKLAPLWPRDGVPLWYVSQRAHVEHGAQVLDASLALLLAARAITPSTAGAAG